MQQQPRLSASAASDEELARLAREGDTVAFNALSERYMPAINGGAGRYSNTVGVDTEDFVQEGMLALYRAVMGYDPAITTRFSTYAITCINNSMVSAIRSHMKNFRQRGALHLDEMDERRIHQQSALRTGDRVVEDLCIGAEDGSHLLTQIEVLLSDFERHVLKLYLSGQSYRETAQVLSTSTKAVDNALQRVRRKLRPTR